MKRNNEMLIFYIIYICGCEYLFSMVVIFVMEWLMFRLVLYNGKLILSRRRINGLEKKRLVEVVVVYKKEVVGGED